MIAPPNPTFLEALETMTIDELREKREWLEQYAGRTLSGHDEIGRNLKLYDEAIACRERGE